MSVLVGAGVRRCGKSSAPRPAGKMRAPRHDSCSALPFTLPSPPQIVPRVLKGERPEVPPRGELPGPGAAAFRGLDNYLALMRRCWAAEPSARPAFGEVVTALGGMLNTCA